MKIKREEKCWFFRKEKIQEEQKWSKATRQFNIFRIQQSFRNYFYTQKAQYASFGRGITITKCAL